MEYDLQSLAIAQLVDKSSDEHSYAGYKNIIGIPIMYQDKFYFYSILDDCFFQAFNSDDRNAIYNLRYFELYAAIYDKDFGKKCQTSLKWKGIVKDKISKPEIMDGLLSGECYLSDIEFDDLSMATNVDYRNMSQIKSCVIKTKEEYEQKLNRPIACPDSMIGAKEKRRKK